MQPCLLYFNNKGAAQQLFAAAAALWEATDEVSYRRDVDRWWPYYNACPEDGSLSPPDCTEAEFAGFTFLNVRHLVGVDVALLGGALKLCTGRLECTRLFCM